LPVSWVCVAVGMVVLVEHPSDGFVLGDQDSHLGLMPFDRATQVSDHRRVQLLATFAADQDLASVISSERESGHAICPLIADLLLFRLPIDPRHGPALEVKGVVVEERLSAIRVSRDAKNVVGRCDVLAVGVNQAFLDQVDGDVGDVYTDPVSIEPLSRFHGSAASAARIGLTYPVQSRFAAVAECITSESEEPIKPIKFF